MNTIDDFVDRRWQDAKHTLRRLDRGFVDKLESTVRLQSMGLSTPWPIDIEAKPEGRLPKQWHRLLEACLELTMEVSRLEVSAQSLGADAHEGIPLRTEFVHAAGSPFAGSVTTKDLWESNVAGSMTPRMFLGEFRYPDECERLRAGKYALFATETALLCDRLGSILCTLEKEIPAISSP